MRYIANFLISILLFFFSIILYTHTKSSYAEFSLVLEERGVSYRIFRYIHDIIFVVLAFIFHVILRLRPTLFVHFWRVILKKIYFKQEREIKWL